MSSEEVRMGCPECHGAAVKNGTIRGGQFMRCKECGHQFMADLERRRLPDEIVSIIKKLLALGVAPELISKAANISSRQAYNYKKQVVNG
ncbi:MAG: hypothetical protein KKD73_01755 [Proteobacteria bacterium]|nr:hypothetical protein [Pseudomonadota bacterium]MBU1640096.1 hypothetical protein [Pseudomonadota bacterium]